MEKRRFMKRNEGYTLTELIIVMAIIAVLTAAAMVTITIIHSAKAKEASTTLESSLSELEANSKGKMCVVAGTQKPDYRFALAIYKEDGGEKYYVKKGFYKGTGAYDDNTSYDFSEPDNVNGKGYSFSAYIHVKYQDASGEREITELDDKPAYIVFDRQGMCIYGSGQYRFYRNDSDTLVSTVVLNKNGSHTSD